MTTPTRQQFNLASAASGFAVGAVVTLLASIAIVPDGNGSPSGGSRPIVMGDPSQFGSGSIGPGEYDDIELEEGEQIGYDAETGQAVVVGATGEVVRTLDGGSGGTGSVDDGGGETAEGGGTGGRTGGNTGGGVEVGGGGTGGAGTGDTTGDGGGGGGSGECAQGSNGGETDVGITGSEIKLGATVAESGIARSFLGEVRQGMEAIRNKVNRAGGICGRQLKIIYRDDGWEPNRGATFIQNLVEQERVFALAVSPSSEGLNQASSQQYLQKQGVPVVGADGLNRTQFSDPMIWPVAAATTTTVHVMMQHAWNRGAKNPAIVFGNTYRFGVEGSQAFNAAYNRLSGSDIPRDRFLGVAAGSSSYATQVSSLNTACNQAPKCDYLMLLLEPSTAQTWMATTGAKGAAGYDKGMGGPQPLFTFGFGRTCGDKCHNMLLWTGYNPPIEQYQSQSAVKGYVSDLKAQSGSADEFNQFTMGGYVGMQLLVQALEQVGPTLTREVLVGKLNSMGGLRTGLTAAPDLVWRANTRHANHSAQAFRIRSVNGFAGWEFAQAPMRDPWLGQ